MRRLILILIFVCLIIPAFAQDAVTSQVLDLLNQERQRIGIPLLVFNAQLIETAQNHSNDMATQGTLTHVGADGSQFWERMQRAGYNLATGAENVLSRSDTNAQGVYQQWYDSPPHQANMLNGEYLEIGIAYAQDNEGRYYFTMVLGSQPGGVPQVAQATATSIPTLQPTRTLPTATNTLIPTPTATNTVMPTDVMLATVIAPLPTNVAAPTQVVGVITPQATATDTLPPDIRLVYSSESFALINISGHPLNIANLSFESVSGIFSASTWNTEFLSQSLTGFTAGDCLQVWGFGEPNQEKPVDCRFRHGWVTVGKAEQFWRDAGFFIVRNGTDLVGACSAEIGLCDINISTPVSPPNTTQSESVFATQTAVDLRLIYDAETFSLINISGHVLDLRGIIFNSSAGRMSIERWNTEFLSQPLEIFTPNDCLQAWGLGSTVVYPKPSECETRHVWIAVGDEFDFWRNTDTFTVEQNGRNIGICSIAANVCHISLSANLGATTSNLTQVIQPTAASSAFGGVRLIITETSFTLLNTSSTAIDVSGFVFESDNGVFVAARWNTEFLSRPLTAIPAGDCLQIWPVGTELQSQPTACDTRHAWVAVRADEQFWHGVNIFRVRWGNQVLGNCETRIGVCDINLP